MKYLSDRNILLLGVVLCVIISILGIKYTQDSYQLLADSNIPLSSTGGLAIIFGSIIAIGAGFAIGGVISGVGILTTYLLRSKEKLTVVVSSAILIILSISSVLGVIKRSKFKLINQKNYIGATEIGIKYSDIDISEISNWDLNYSIIGNLKKEGIFSTKNQNLIRSGKSMIIDFNPKQISLYDNVGKKQLLTYLGNKYYEMESISYTIFNSTNNKSYLCILANIEENHYSSLFLMFNENGEKVYEAIIKRPS